MKPSYLLVTLLSVICGFFSSLTWAQAPDDWKRFTAHQQKNTVQLHWETNAEYGSVDFLIQHSTNGQYWSTIGSTRAAGFSSTVQSYKFIHQTPVQGTNHYRIVLMDENSRAITSRSLAVEVKETNLILIYPNPVNNGVLNLQLGAESDITIFTRHGKAVYQKHCAAGKSSVYLSELPAGLYQLKAGDEVQSFFIR